MSSKIIETCPTDNLNCKKQDILYEYSIIKTIGKGTFSLVKLGENKKNKRKSCN